jgi:DNA replication protein DnaC
VPARYLDCTFENYEVSKGSEAAFKALSGLQSLSDPIYLGGDVGAGKTHLSVALMRNLALSQINRGNFQSATGLLLDLKSSFNQDGISERDAISRYTQPDILIIDDLGSEKLTDYIAQSWYHIIDFRYANLLPTVVTSNLSLDEISMRLGDRVASRLASGKVITIKGKDRRL